MVEHQQRLFLGAFEGFENVDRSGEQCRRSSERADAFNLWRTARAVHAERHGWAGGGLALLKVESDVRAALTGGRLLPWDRTPEQLEAIAKRLGRMYGRRPIIMTPRVGH